MTGPRIGSLFAGYGGLELGVAQVLGGEPAWFSEIEPAPSKILTYHWPDVPNYGDITKIDWGRVPTVDVITGGSPCQDLSHAGKRVGMRAGTRSGLWASMCDAIDVIRPSLVVWENVRGALSAPADSAMGPCPVCVGDRGDVHLRALGRVVGDLSELGYSSRWVSVRASDAGAPHGRFRVFIYAWPATDTTRDGRHEGRTQPTRLQRGPHAAQRSAVNWGDYEPAIRRWEAVTGRLVPPPTEPGRNGAPRLSPTFVEWMMGLPHGHVTGVPGLSRNDQLKALGNGVVPQQAAHATRIWAATTQGTHPTGTSGDSTKLLPTPAAHEPGGTLEQYRERWRRSDGRQSMFMPLTMLAQTLTDTSAETDADGGLW